MDHSDQPYRFRGAAAGRIEYDGHKRRVKSTLGGKARYSVYDASGALVMIDNATDGETSAYIRSGGMTLARKEGADFTWLHHDHLGSAVAGSDATGAVLWRESDYPFGEQLIEAAANQNQAGYTGHVEE